MIPMDDSEAFLKVLYGLTVWSVGNWTLLSLLLLHTLLCVYDYPAECCNIING